MVSKLTSQLDGFQQSDDVDNSLGYDEVENSMNSVFGTVSNLFTNEVKNVELGSGRVFFSFLKIKDGECLTLFVWRTKKNSSCFLYFLKPFEISRIQVSISPSQKDNLMLNKKTVERYY